jgi:hypothetical protein
MQKNQRPQARISGRFEREAAIGGLHGRRCGHARSPDFPSQPMLTGRQRMESNNFRFKAILLCRQQNPATSLQKFEV